MPSVVAPAISVEFLQQQPGRNADAYLNCRSSVQIGYDSIMVIIRRICTWLWLLNGLNAMFSSSIFSAVSIIFNEAKGSGTYNLSLVHIQQH